MRLIDADKLLEELDERPADGRIAVSVAKKMIREAKGCQDLIDYVKINDAVDLLQKKLYWKEPRIDQQISEAIETLGTAICILSGMHIVGSGLIKGEQNGRNT